MRSTAAARLSARRPMSTTSRPAAAKIWAMPWPMRPFPTTATGSRVAGTAINHSSARIFRALRRANGGIAPKCATPDPARQPRP